MAGRPPLPPIYIAGVAETPLGKVLDHTENSMVALAAHEALAEAGMSLRDVDALFVNYMGEEGSVRSVNISESSRAMPTLPTWAADPSRPSYITP